MDCLDAIFERRSVREYQEKPLEEAALQTILKAGMAGPSCVDARDWSFVVVQDRETLNKMADANGSPAQPLRGCAAAVLVCGDLSRAFPPAKEYWIIDCAIAAQNMVLAAQSMGIGSVWLGTWPQQERVNKQAALFGLPDGCVPHSILAFGYPRQTQAAAQKKPDCYDATRVHRERW